jgi:hypothetical protein
MAAMLTRFAAQRGVARRSPRLRLGTSAPASAAFFSSGYSASDTIYALSSAQGKAGVAVVRISGSQADECLQRLTKSPRLPSARM